MRASIKAILFSMLLVLLHAQTGSTTTDIYSLGGQTYQYIYGTGASGSNNLGDRPEAEQNAFVADSHYVPPRRISEPITVNCPRHQVYNNILCECVCILGYYWGQGTCLPFDPRNPVCGRNQVYKDYRCQCDLGYFLIGTICDVCPPYSTYNMHTRSCDCAQGYVLQQGECRKIYVPPVVPVPVVPKCGVNEQLIGNICTCLPDFYLVRGVCTYCVSPNYYDAQLSICRPTCSAKQQLDLASLTCICIGGFQNINGQCDTCPEYAIYNKFHKRCDCIDGYYFNSGLCIPKTTPPTQTPPTPVQPRVCADPNAFEVNGFCVCKAPYHLINNVCQECPTNYFYDADLGVCRIPCLANEVYNIVQGVCECAATYYKIRGVCQQCKGNSTFDAVSQSCVCPAGYSQDAQGNCILGCGVNQILKNGLCCCKEGYYPVNGVCGMCQWNEIYDQGLGLCRIPCDHTRTFDISLKTCVCLPHLYEMADGTCETCVIHSVYDPLTKSCPCERGYLKSLGLCIPSCNAYEIYVDGKCICKEGYYLIGYSCGLCPPTEVYDATYRICHKPCQTNEVWDPIIRACRCLPGYYLINDVCGQCDPRTQIYSHRHGCCVCIEGYQRRSGQGCHGVCTPICSVNQDYILNRCVCKPGYYLINNFCTKCPEGQIYDIYNRVCRVQCGRNQEYDFNIGKCVCTKGFYLIQGMCSKCLGDETYDEYTQTCSSIPCKGVNEYYSEITRTCICKKQYVRIKGICTNCNPGQYYDSYSDKCLCLPGYTFKGGFCEAICPKGSTYINGKCICDDGMPVYKGECRIPKICPLYSHWDKYAECCICNAGYRVINGKCSSYQYCGVNGYLQYGQCYCKEGYFWILNACRACGVNEAFNGVTCECYLGYSRNANGVCVKTNVVPKCYENERYDAVLKACVCVDGTQFIRGKCVTIPTCPANSYYNSIECVCFTGFTMNNNECVNINIPVPACPANSYFNGVSCTCNFGVFQQDLNSCAVCPDGTNWNGNKCAEVPPHTCAPGYFFNEKINQCQPEAPSCGAFGYFNGAVCDCLDGYNWINSKCTKCPADTYFDGAQCSPRVVPPAVVCGSNQIAVDGKCVCNSGLYLIGDKCLACPPYTTWNGKFCQCGCDTSEWCLGQPFSAWDTTNKVCNCQSGFTRVNGICTQA